jgi:hypothetical protein
MKELQGISDHLFIDFSAEYELARTIWEKIVADSTFMHKVRAVQGKTPFLIPTWTEKLDATFSVAIDQKKYCVVAVDGSQIYPDRHQGTPCYLINIGSVMLAYGIPGYSAQFSSVPSVYSGEQEEDLANSPDTVNCRRQELEFSGGIAMSKQFQPIAQANNVPYIFLFDGSLIFWHLESKDETLKNMFLGTYIASLHQFYMTKTLVAGYISLPKNKELVNLLRLDLCNFNFNEQEAHKEVDHLVDTIIADFFLEPYTRSIVFKNHASICQTYPDHLHPYFFYVHVGSEIGRVEIPAWIASDAASVNLIASIIIDQSIKGRGYPVALAESHEQAVVKGPDREFFYQLISKIGFDKNQRLRLSQKSIKKRGIGI